ncbi:hypothetical protein GCM10027048_06550 [Hymenobacter coalescens]
MTQLCASFSFLLKRSGLVWLAAAAALTAQAQPTATVTTGFSSLASTNPGPIYRSTAASSFLASQYAYVFDNAELAAAGLLPGDRITAIAWEKTSNGASNRPATFRILLKNSTQTTYTAPAGFADLTTGATQVFADAVYLVPATVGNVSFPFSTPFTYTGRSLEVFTDWLLSSTGTGNPSTGSFLWAQYTVPDRILGFAAAAPFTTALSPTSNGPSSVDDRRPKTTFTYTRVTGAKTRVLLSGGAYPNPTAGPVRLQLNSAFRGRKTQVTVLDATGRVLGQRPLSATGYIDLQDLAAGTYLIRLTLGELTEVHRVQLQR